MGKKAQKGGEKHELESESHVHSSMLKGFYPDYSTHPHTTGGLRSETAFKIWDYVHFELKLNMKFYNLENFKRLI